MKEFDPPSETDFPSLLFGRSYLPEEVRSKGLSRNRPTTTGKKLAGGFTHLPDAGGPTGSILELSLGCPA